MQVKVLVKEVRKEQHITLDELAEKTGISKSHINDVENRVKEPGLSILIRLAKALNVKITDLYKVIW